MDISESPHIAKLRARNRARHGGEFLYEDAAWMRCAYVDRGLTMRQMATEAGCGLRTIARWLKLHGIETRQDWQRATGARHPRWRGASICPECGSRKSASAKTCLSCQDRNGDKGSNWRGDAIEYTGAHYRLVARRGRASEHPCAHCGKPADEWAYDGEDPDERRNTRGRDDAPFSLDPDHYMPLCMLCHRRFDLADKPRGWRRARTDKKESL